MNRDTLIVFDCDGVLVDSEPLAAIAFERAHRRHGMAITGDLVGQSIGMKQADILLRIRDLTGHHFPAGSEADIWDETKLLFTEQLLPVPGVAAFPAAWLLPRPSNASRTAFLSPGWRMSSATRSSARRWSRAASPRPKSSCMPPRK